MLTSEEKNKIIESIKQGKTDYAIEKETGNAHKTIKEIRENYYMALGKQIHEDKLNSKSTIDNLRRTDENIDRIIKSGQLEEKEKKELEKRSESLKTLLRLEVDERIPSEIAKAIEKRDQYWIKFIEQHYTKKEVLEVYKKKLKEKNIINENILDENKKIDYINIKNQTIYQQNLSKKQDEIDSFIGRYRYLENQNLDIMNENIYLINYNNNYLENHVRINQNELNSQEIIINKLKKDFLSNQRDMLKSFNDFLIKFYEKEKDILNCKDEFANLINNINICIENINIEIGFLNKIREQQEIKVKDYKNVNNLEKN